VIEDLSRTTPNHRIADALEQLGEASAAFGDGRYQKALRHALKAKELAPRDATVREVLALSAYRTGDWKQALRELRTYRRLSGELTHVPVEMDVLRALGRDEEIPKVWRLLQDHGAKPPVMKEARVVYASHLLDREEVAAAREIVAPGRLSDRPFEEDLRLWYVAARAAAMDGDGNTARRLRNAILQHDPSFPGIDDLEKLIARTP
jgi:tetratricopeptide (TPR) repeat protein